MAVCMYVCEDDLSMEQQLVAEAVFIALTDEFNSYLSKQDVGKS